MHVQFVLYTCLSAQVFKLIGLEVSIIVPLPLCVVSPRLMFVKMYNVSVYNSMNFMQFALNCFWTYIHILY